MSGKDKLRKFAEIRTFNNVIEPDFSEVFKKDYKLKSNWSEQIFGNNNPIVLELGCGKGEYTVAMARKWPNKNFIGVDVKGNRIWRGAKTALEEDLKNVAFLRTRIEFIESFFAAEEVNEIWVTFPDPQPKLRRRKNRLTSMQFLNRYRNLLQDNGIVHLKTDSYPLYKFTHDLVVHNNLQIEIATDNLYHSGITDDILSVQTYYEQKFMAEGYDINYLTFLLPKNKEVTDLPEDYEELTR